MGSDGGELNVFAEFKPKLPEKYRESKYVFLANIAPDLQREVLQQVKKRPKIAALDTMNYWIERSNEDLRETLKHVDILMINDSETRQLSNEHNLLRAAKHIFKMGPSTLVVKRGEYGAMMVDRRGVFCVPAFPLEEPHDPTGAGDSFAGGFMGYLAAAGDKSDASLRRAMVYGSVLGSFTVEKFGLDRLRIGGDACNRAAAGSAGTRLRRASQYSGNLPGQLELESRAAGARP